mgnify:CR=1 FL=1
MSDPVYIPLRLHSEYSITDGTVRLKALIKKALAEGLPALGISDLMNGFGLVKFYKACRGAGIKPVIGADVRIENPDRPDTPFRALLLVKNHNGYLRLSELLTRAFTCQEEGRLPQLKQAWLGEGGNEGLICLSGAHYGEVGLNLMNGHETAAEAADMDLEVTRAGNVITLEFEDRSQMVINSHEAAGEVWVASKRGGFHFRPGEQGWIDTRSGRELLDLVADEIGFHAGQPIDLSAIRFTD